MHTMFDNITEK